MADGSPGIRRVFTRHGDNLDNLFRRKGGKRARAGLIGQGPLNHGGERFVTALVGVPLCQLGDEDAPRQPLGTGLTACNLLQASPLSCGHLHPGGDGGRRRNGAGRTSILSGELGHF